MGMNIVPCEICGEPGRILRLTRGYDVCTECLGNLVENEMQRRAVTKDRARLDRQALRDAGQLT